ncbi:amylo-alpha-1,6-glucosidase [Truepera radiovictrix]|uniref:Glycoside hydrolase family 37 n=1 Tax=Truepera radiovictrix (strain DSM 17093 / CIP 108686 / LMG 22925 / RQ-24) TaxID=649638 RepID=D7CUU1_TRURR|nr:trehalase family glycosidase [Truepera radiovictrix]ADI14082.1 glycoside hydrolase family 37 [Truepera radiovictrix DSM 17093]WMT57356.1 trehalase family glycosidase [Truepera radiovictrix]
MSVSAHLAGEAQRILRDNDTGRFIKPSPKQYPHQWNWDAALIALGLATFDLERARAEVRTLLEGQWKDGMVPHIVYHDGPSDYFPTPDFWRSERSAAAPSVPTSGLTQPPVLATAVRAIVERDPDQGAALTFLREVYGKLLAWHRWFYAARDPEGSGVVALIHPWESGMDNSTRFTGALARLTPTDVPTFRRRDQQHVAADERPVAGDYERFMYLIGLYRDWRWDPEALFERAPFLIRDAFTTAILHRANEDLLELATSLGEPTEEIAGWLARTRAGYSALWDEAAGLYFDLDLRAGAPVREDTCATFLALYAGLASEAQAARLAEHLRDPDAYAPDARTRFYLPSAAKSSPYFEPRRYWRGPVWLNINWFLVQGLRRYGYAALAERVVNDTLSLVARSGFAEYYDPRDGSPCGARDFSWSAALVLELL